MATSHSPTAAARHALVERLFEGVLGMIDVYTVYMGDRLGIYRALTEGKATEGQIAAVTGVDRRYLREWLEQQAVAGLIEAEDPSQPAAERRYTLPEAHAEVLLDRDSPSYMSAFARMMAGLVRPLPRVVEAFRSGDGVPYASFDVDFLEGQGDMNRVQFVNSLASEWMPALPDVHERLQSGGRVADVACGAGWSTIVLARAYPRAEVHGLDLDAASIELARANAAEEGIDIRFEARDAADPRLSGRYDLVTCFEAVHDMSRPVESLRGMRSLLADHGVLLVGDERVADRFTAPGDEVERLMYGFSVFHCLAVGREEQPSAATGTVMRTDTLRGYAEEAGFTRFEVLPIENDFWRFYRLEGGPGGQ
jgi:SAM-dependent methyltransferase